MRFSNLSAGYCGIFKTPSISTLNSKILATIRLSLGNGEVISVFPQRVPRLGFFEELSLLETPQVSSLMGLERDWLIEQLTRELFGNTERVVSLIKYGTRIGLARELKLVLEKLASSSLSLRFEAAFVDSQIALHSGQEINLEPLVQIFDSARAKRDEWLAAKCACRIVVAKARYCPTAKVERFNELSTFLQHFLDNYRPNSFAEKISHATLRRGLAMSPILSEGDARHCVQTAYEETSAISPESELETWLRDELLFTTLQSLAKAHAANGNFEETLKLLKKLTQIDPLDSTGWSELGMFHIQHKEWAQALPFLESSTKLGPPGLAMNAYFCGVAHSEQNQISKAKDWFVKSSSWDKTAISPLLGLIESYKRDGEANLAQKTARFILSTDSLNEQLTFEERTELEVLCTTVA